MEPIQFTPFPELMTTRLQLRQLRAEDAPAMYLLRSDPGVMRFIPRPLLQHETEALALINMYNESAASNDAINWAIAEKGGGLIGAIGFVRLKKEHFRGEVGYLLAPGHQGKGLMREALEAVMHYGFEVMKLHSIEAVIDPENHASAALLERSGFVKEAHFRENEFLLGQFRDTAIYSKLTHVR